MIWGEARKTVFPAVVVAVTLSLSARADASAPLPAPTPAPPVVAAPPPAARTSAPVPVTVVPPPPGAGPESGLAPVAAIPDPVRIAPAEVVFVNPLYRAVDTPPKLLDRPGPRDLQTKTTIILALKLSEKGQVLEAKAVEPPLAGLGTQAVAQSQKWTFEPARKDDRPVATWNSYGFNLNVEVEKGAFSTFGLALIGRTDSLPLAWPEAQGDSWLLRYPRQVEPSDPSVVSVEEVDTIPSPRKASWRFNEARLRSTVTALVEIGADGMVARLIPTSPPYESVIVEWMRKTVATWKFAPAQAGGKAVSCWMALDASLEYEVTTAKETAKRSFKKNLRGSPVPPS